eukprot:6468436-Amphidinium_carterae.3
MHEERLHAITVDACGVQIAVSLPPELSHHEQCGRYTYRFSSAISSAVVAHDASHQVGLFEVVFYATWNAREHK